jgi:hypothetical protein
VSRTRDPDARRILDAVSKLDDMRLRRLRRKVSR